GLLHGLGHDDPGRHLHEAAVEAGELVLGPHAGDHPNRLLPHGPGVVRVDAEPTQLGHGDGAARPHVQAALAEDVEGGRALRHPGRMVEGDGEEHDAVADADAAGVLGHGREEDLRGRAVGEALQEVVLDAPHVVEADLLGQLHLLDGLPVDVGLGGPELGVHLHLVQQPELHRRPCPSVWGTRGSLTSASAYSAGPRGIGQDGPVPRSGRPRALVTAPFRGSGLEHLRQLADVVLDPWIEHTPLRLYSAEQLAERIGAADATIVVCEADHCAGPVFDLPLRVVGSTRGDPTNVDLAGATAAGIPVLRAPARNADAVAEMTLALLLAVTRGIVPADADVRRGEVYRDGTIPYQRYRAWEIKGRTAGLVGLGAVGRDVRWRLEALGMRVLAYDPYADDASSTLEEVLEAGDVISLHAAVTSETDGMIGPAEFARMGDGVVFLNTA